MKAFFFVAALLLMSAQAYSESDVSRPQPNSVERTSEVSDSLWSVGAVRPEGPHPMDGKICMVRDGSGWQVSFVGMSVYSCSESLVVSLEPRVLYFNFNDTSGRMKCRGESRRYEGYLPCNSVFMKLVHQDDGSVFVVDSAALGAVFRNYGIFTELESRRAELMNLRQEEWVQKYRADFAAISNVAKAQTFAKKYSDQDPEGLVKKATDMIPRLAAKAEEEERESERTSRLRYIGFCREQVEMARRTIQRQREAGAISGYIDKRAMQEAGMAIANCNANVPIAYDAYRKAGGTRPLKDFW